MARNACHTVTNCLRWHCHTTTCQIPGPSTWLCLLFFSLFPNPLFFSIVQSSFSHLATYPRRFFFSNNWCSFYNILRKTSESTPSWNSQAWQTEKGRGCPVIWVARAKNTKKLIEQFLCCLTTLSALFSMSSCSTDTNSKKSSFALILNLEPQMCVCFSLV